MSDLTAPKVTKIEILDDLKIKIHWDGNFKIVDLNDSDLPSRFPKLKDRNYFQSAKLTGGAISWPEGLHLDLDELVYDWPDVKNYAEKIAGHYSSSNI